VAPKGHTSCDKDPPFLSSLCDKAADTTGCCNLDFVYGTILESDIRDQAPNPITPESGPFSTPFQAILAGPALEQLAPLIDLELGPVAGSARCAFGVVTHNPVDIFPNPQGDHSLRNGTRPGHMLVGNVDQYVSEDEDGVYSRIQGSTKNSNARLGGFNELVGPVILGTVRDFFHDRVQAALSKIESNGMCCVDGILKGGTLSFEADGNILPKPSREPDPACSGSGTAGAGTGGSSNDGSGNGGEANGGAGNEAGEGNGEAGSGQAGEFGGGIFPPGWPDPPPNQSDSLGDPHLRTFDGARYDCQAWGELTLLHDDRDGDSDVVQVRTHQLLDRNVAVNVAVAVRLGSDMLTFEANGLVHAKGNDEPLALGDGKTTYDGGDVYRSGSAYAVVWPDNTQLRFQPNGTYIGLALYVPEGRRTHVSGLFGNFDDAPTNDLWTRQGDPIAEPVSFVDFYGRYAKSWRITDDHSLFYYPPRKTTADFTNLEFPLSLATLDGLTESDRATASTLCATVAVPAAWRDACTLDEVSSNFDASFAQGFVNAPATRHAVTIQPPAAPVITSVFPQSVAAGQSLMLQGANLVSLSGDATNVTVLLSGASGSGVANQALSIVAISPTQITVSVPPTLYQTLPGPDTVTVLTPFGSASASTPVFLTQANGFGGDAGTGSLLGGVYRMTSGTAHFPAGGTDEFDLSGPCSNSTVVSTPGESCPLTTISVSNLDLPQRSFTQGFPGVDATLSTYFAIKFRGYLTIDTPGTYQFRTCADDGEILYIASTPEVANASTAPPSFTTVTSNDTLSSMGCVAGSMTFPSAGAYRIVADYFQGPGSGLGITLQWTPPGGTQVIVPSDHLKPVFP
jgi:hypothetical protein